MDLAVLIITHHRAELLEKCLQSIELQKDHTFNIKYHILINGSDSLAEQLLESKNIPFIANEKPLPVGEARNLLLDRVASEYICFLDDDIILPEGYFHQAEQIISTDPSLDIFGGPDQNAPGSSIFQSTLSLVMESFFATGPTNKRHKIEKTSSEEADEVSLTLCNFWAKPQVFKKHRFPKAFKRNEENFLLAMLKSEGIKMQRIPQMFVFHHRKVSLWKIARVLFLAGVYRTVSNIYFPKGAKLIFFIPQAVLLIGVYALFNMPPFFLFLAGVYLAIVEIESIKIALKLKSIQSLFISLILFPIFNFVYPLGQFFGYLKALLFLAKGQKI